MADLQISVKDEQTARQWLTMVQDINTDYQKAMTDAAETMINMQDFADGTLVDDFVKYGTDLLNAAQTTFEAIDSIADTVNNILSKVTNFVTDAVGGIGKLVGKVLGN